MDGAATVRLCERCAPLLAAFCLTSLWPAAAAAGCDGEVAAGTAPARAGGGGRGPGVGVGDARVAALEVRAAVTTAPSDATDGAAPPRSLLESTAVAGGGPRRSADC